MGAWISACYFKHSLLFVSFWRSCYLGWIYCAKRQHHGTCCSRCGPCRRAFARIWAICTALVPAAATFKGSGNFGRLGQVIRSRKKGECLGRRYPISGPFIALYFLFTRRGAASLQQAPASIMFCSRAWNSLQPWTRINSPSYNLLIVDIVSQCCKTQCNNIQITLEAKEELPKEVSDIWS